MLVLNKTHAPVRSLASPRLSAVAHTYDETLFLWCGLEHFYKTIMSLVVLIETEESFQFLPNQWNATAAYAKADINFSRYNYETVVDLFRWIPGSPNLADSDSNLNSSLQIQWLLLWHITVCNSIMKRLGQALVIWCLAGLFQQNWAMYIAQMKLSNWIGKCFGKLGFDHNIHYKKSPSKMESWKQSGTTRRSQNKPHQLRIEVYFYTFNVLRITISSRSKVTKSGLPNFALTVARNLFRRPMRATF